MNQNAGHVTVMRSFDYCHFEVCLPLPEMELVGEFPSGDHLKRADDIRKEAARMVDKAIEQYKESKRIATMRTMSDYELKQLRRDVGEIKGKPENERTAYEKGQVKALEDYDYWTNRDFNYDYDDES